MKKHLSLFVLLLSVALLLVGCSVPGGTVACQHRDVNDDSACDFCSITYADGKDIPDAPVCQHRDINDDSMCDKCDESYADGKDIPDAPVCQHRDADDNEICDHCNYYYVDGKDIPDAPVCQHRDANDDEVCDECNEPYTDGKDIPDAPVCRHRDANDDTACDSCGGYYEDGKDLLDAPVCQHRDADDNGKCDKCGGAYIDGKDIPDPPVCLHSDADKDHVCDYGCAIPFGSHEDQNLDHVCDYGCSVKDFGDHEDLNKDHACDYGCDAPIGTHEDQNLDHACDYGCPVEDFGDHEDLDKDHACDYGCDIPFDTHADCNADHLCDLYGADCGWGSIGLHADGNLDHVCDYGCMERIGKCEDTNEDDLCDYGCGKSFAIEDTPAYTRDGDYIYFGEYPQTLKADGVTITETQDSRGYYLGSDGYYYAKVKATPPWDDEFTFSTGATVSEGSVYYFKVEPIRWRILSTDGETALILCDSIIANMAFQPDYYYNSNDGEFYTTANGAPSGTYINNYEYSAVRAWLNEQFYETAFSELQKEVILVTEVDNSVYSTGDRSNPYACEDTDDKIFLLSHREVTNSEYGFSSDCWPFDTARRMLTSDYARATGAYTYDGNGYWWLRSPLSDCNYGARLVSFYGDASSNDEVYNSGHGVVPALQIRL